MDQHLTEEGLFGFQKVEDVWQVLDVSYCNPNEKSKARRALVHLRQGARPFGAYLAEFQCLKTLAGISDDRTLIDAIRYGVTQDLRTKISD